MPFSRTGLIDQLVHDGYGKGEATAAVDSLTVNYNEQAAKQAKSYLEIMPFSRSDLIQQLVHDGFTQKQAAHGATQAGL